MKRLKQQVSLNILSQLFLIRPLRVFFLREISFKSVSSKNFNKKNFHRNFKFSTRGIELEKFIRTKKKASKMLFTTFSLATPLIKIFLVAELCQLRILKHDIELCHSIEHGSACLQNVRHENKIYSCV